MFQQNQQITWLKNLSVFAPEDDVHNTEEEKDTKDLQCWKEVPPFPNMKFFYMHVQIFSAMAMVSDETSFQWKFMGLLHPVVLLSEQEMVIRNLLRVKSIH